VPLPAPSLSCATCTLDDLTGLLEDAIRPLAAALSDAGRALEDLRAGRFQGAAVIKIDR
jgi:hypothetical protein